MQKNTGNDVMAPTLALTVAREAEIRAFRPEDFYTVILSTEIGDLGSKRFSGREEAKEQLIKCTLAGKLTITKAEKKEKQEKAPTLFDLTTLQREANKRSELSGHRHCLPICEKLS